MKLTRSTTTLFKYIFVPDGHSDPDAGHTFGKMEVVPTPLWEDDHGNFYKLLADWDSPEVEINSELTGPFDPILHTERILLCVDQEGYAFMKSICFIVKPRNKNTCTCGEDDDDGPSLPHKRGCPKEGT